MVTVFVVLVIALWKFLTYPFEPLARFICRKEKDEEKRDKKEFVCLLICLIIGYAILKSPDMVYTYVMKHHESSEFWFATVYKGNIIKNLIMDCQSYTKYRPNETTGGIFVSWRRKEDLPTGA